MKERQCGALEAVKLRGTAVQLRRGVNAFLMRLLLVGFAMLVIGASCTRPVGESASDRGVSVDPGEFSGIDLDVDQARNDAINEAIQVATTGCPGVPDKLSGAPTRILMAVAPLALTGRFVNPEANFEDLGDPLPGLGGRSAVSVWVVAIEGDSTTGVGDGTSGTRSDLHSFVFVLAPWNPIITGCVVRDAPMATRINHLLYGSFEFDVLFDLQ